MTRRIRGTDKGRSYPVDRASDQPEKAPSGLDNGGIRDAWLQTIPATTEDARRAAVRYLTRKGHADLLDVLGLPCGQEALRG